MKSLKKFNNGYKVLYFLRMAKDTFCWKNKLEKRDLYGPISGKAFLVLQDISNAAMKYQHPYRFTLVL